MFIQMSFPSISLRFSFNMVDEMMIESMYICIHVSVLS